MQILHNGSLVQLIETGRSTTPSLCQIKSNDKGAKITSFNMLKFLIHNKRGPESDPGRATDSCVQFSQLKFKNKNGLVFQYSTNDDSKETLRNEVQASCSWGQWCDHNNEDGVSGLMLIGQKCCIENTEIPIKGEEGIDFEITYKLLNTTLDVSIFNTWSFYTANDEPERDPWFFELQVRNENDDGWQTVDMHLEGTLLAKDTERNTLAYDGTIDINKLK